jgi:hypothetical protein
VVGRSPAPAPRRLRQLTGRTRVTRYSCARSPRSARQAVAPEPDRSVHLSRPRLVPASRARRPARAASSVIPGCGPGREDARWCAAPRRPTRRRRSGRAPGSRRGRTAPRPRRGCATRRSASAPPRAPRSIARISSTWFGSSPTVGSSSTTSGGAPSSASAIPTRWRYPRLSCWIGTSSMCREARALARPAWTSGARSFAAKHPLIAARNSRCSRTRSSTIQRDLLRQVADHLARASASPPRHLDPADPAATSPPTAGPAGSRNTSRISVDLPAPFGPSNPTREPGATRKLTASCSACTAAPAVAMRQRGDLERRRAGALHHGVRRSAGLRSRTIRRSAFAVPRDSLRCPPGQPSPGQPRRRSLRVGGRRSRAVPWDSFVRGSTGVTASGTGPGRMSSGSRWISASAQMIASLTSWLPSPSWRAAVLERLLVAGEALRRPSPRRSARRTAGSVSIDSAVQQRDRGAGVARGDQRASAGRPLIRRQGEHAIGLLEGDAVDQALAAHLVRRVRLGRACPCRRT